MATLSDNITQAVSDFDEIQKAIIYKGVNVPDGTPTSEYSEKIMEITTGDTPINVIPKIITQNGVYNSLDDDLDGYNPVTVDVQNQSEEWIRPLDRPTVPTLNPNEVYILYKVMPNGINDMALQITGTGYLYDWGDGTTDSPTNNQLISHTYNFATLSKPTNVDGSKWVWLKISIPSGVGNFGTFATHIRPVGRPSGSSSSIWIPNIYEFYAYSATTNFDMTWGAGVNAYTRWRNLEIMSIKNINDTYVPITNNYFCCWCSSLRILDMKMIVSITGFLSECVSFNQVLDLQFPNSNFGLGNFLYGCSNYNQPLPSNLNSSYATSLIGFLQNCTRYNQPLPSGFVTSSVNTTNGFNNFMDGCNSFEGIFTIDLMSLPNAFPTSAFNYCTKMKGLRFLNVNTTNTGAINIANTGLNEDALALLFGDLPDRTSTTSAVITITGTPGASNMTSTIKEIATNKNYTITGALI